MPSVFTKSAVRLGVGCLLFVAATFTIPRWWCGREGKRWFSGDAALSSALGREVAATVNRSVSAAEFTSDSKLFRHEWQFGTYQMAALGLMQACHEHPALRSELLPAAERAIDRLLSSEVRDFDARKWGEDPLDSLAGPNGHAAYLGYLNLVLGMHRCWVPGSRFASINDRITSALIRRFRESRTGVLETYPGEAYPMDIAAALASVMLHQRATGEDHAAVVSPVLVRYRTTWRDPQSGLLFQAVDARDGAPIGRARASGTALAAFLLSYGEREVSRGIFAAVRSQSSDSIIGFGFVREYPTHSHGGRGDIDSGPIILGISPSATGFSIAGSRVFGDRDLFVRLVCTAHLVGAPVSLEGRRCFVTGGPLGNAIMLAMLTAQPTPP